MTDHSVSVRARLLNLARQEGEDFQRLLIRFAIERLLYRLSNSEHADDFVLKGAVLRTPTFWRNLFEFSSATT